MMQQVFQFLTVLGAVQGIFFSLVLLQLPAGQRLANRFLALFLVVFSVSMLGITAYSSRYILQFPALGLAHLPFGAILGAPFVVYLQALTQKSFRYSAWQLLLFAPFVVVLVWAIPFWSLPTDEKRQVLEASYLQWPVYWTRIYIFSNLVNCMYLLCSYLLVLRHERLIREVYSSPLHKTLLWVRHFLFVGIAIFTTCVLLSFYNIAWADAFSNLAFSIAIYVFGFRAMRQPDIFADVRADTLPEQLSTPLVRATGRYEKSGLSEEKAQRLLDRLEELMRTEQLFLQPALNLQQLALRLEAPPHQVSQVLNQVRGESFSDVINRYRVEYFIGAMSDPARAHLSLLALAMESGFNSKAAFNAVFKKMTGQTPSDYRDGRR